VPAQSGDGGKTAVKVGGVILAALVLIVGMCAVVVSVIPKSEPQQTALSDSDARLGDASTTSATTSAAMTATSAPVVPATAPTTTAAPRPTCDPSYPTVCIPPAPPDLDCTEISAHDFTVVGADPHGFDSDHDGIGCESAPPPPPPAPPAPVDPPAPPAPPANCDANYPTICVRPFAQGDLDCGEIPYRNFPVPGADPHRFDSDHDGIGCES
jgi:hypothetical protein